MLVTKSYACDKIGHCSSTQQRPKQNLKALVQELLPLICMEN